MNKYFATVSLLAEANSRFGSNAKGGVKLAGVKWAIFPSVQLGWVLSNEDWFPKNAGINYLRLNAGFDMSGNDDISNYAARTSFTSVRYNYQEIGAQLTNVGNEVLRILSVVSITTGPTMANCATLVSRLVSMVNPSH